jgi:hypothetical protein
MPELPERDHCYETQPIEGCDCDHCEYARYWEALSDDERKRELDAMAQYADEQDRL